MKFVKIDYIKSNKREWTRLVPFFAALLLLVIVIVCALSVFAGIRIISPPKEPLYYFSANVVPEYKDVSFWDINKTITLKGWYFSRSANTKTVILVHGYGRNRFNFGRDSLEMIKALLSKDYNVLAFDLRNSGTSGGKQCTLGYLEKDDVLGAISYVRSQGIKKISLLGFSTGANASLLAAGSDSTRIDAVIADSPYYSAETYLNDFLFTQTKLPGFIFNKLSSVAINLLTGININDLNMDQAMAGVASKPMLLINGTKDSIVPLSEGRKLLAEYKKASGIRGELWEINSERHAEYFIEKPEEYMGKILKFLDEVYKATP